ncbi:phosphotransferase [Streptomyces fuscigenes]|uniref:phosphotransferase n=1 Tax=Streptomyces fuscigenes TaxID=1528880 RepID=UPI001F308501|nr:phosphotransferase [Streptomyces fuscigenes]MCF3960922.1 phosphotransferase [Streptomyces fuscigenes]
MIEQHLPWGDLPAPLRAAIQQHTGVATSAESIEQGLNCSAAVRLWTARSSFFVKVVRGEDTEGLAGLAQEQLVAPLVGAVSPALRLAVREAGWRALVFDLAPGRTADLSAGSPDVEAVAALVQRLADLPSPPAGLPQFADRYATHLLPGNTELRRGEHLLHTDTNPHNLLVDGTIARLVDWAMPAVGPAWIDAALTAVRLMEDGQQPAAALTWLDRIPSWRRARPGAVAAFVDVICRDWAARIGERAAEPSNARYRALLGRSLARVSG